MQRQHPMLSATGLVMTVLVLVVLAVVYWRTGGQMFSPGPLAFAHADVEDCASCHQPFDHTQAELCVECHTEIQTELTLNEGLHARLRSPDQCRDCHPDHRGTDFDPRAAALTNFDHELTFFSLAHHGLDYESVVIECAVCHRGDDFEPEQGACVDCHTGHDPVFMAAHQADFEADCQACHDGADTMADFNHATTQFPLTGAHTEAACMDCHSSASLIAGIAGESSGLALQCAACHAEPALHAGLFQSTCEDCHSTNGWTPARMSGVVFDHFAESGFSLAHHEFDFDGSLMDCRACHVESLREVAGTVCETCHTAAAPDFMAAHTSDFGLACVECHDGVDSMVGFDHNAVFVLDGSHDDLACSSCHVSVSPSGETVHTFAGTPSDCAGCHAEPDIHAGLFGLNCASCHNTFAWAPAALTSHTFPLNHGGEGEIACSVCHATTFTQYTCDRCHEPGEMAEDHADEDIFDIAGRCVDCHPTGREDEVEN
ncbi:MAG TPA: cytochrome c3 family protein [Anaerolineales bacterium]|nr:cytochrome c3 family protein [Anaerolineales bacterium]